MKNKKRGQNIFTEQFKIILNLTTINEWRNINDRLNGKGKKAYKDKNKRLYSRIQT